LVTIVQIERLTGLQGCKRCGCAAPRSGTESFPRLVGGAELECLQFSVGEPERGYLLRGKRAAVEDEGQ
jgi:hypothetical protein